MDKGRRGMSTIFLRYVSIDKPFWEKLDGDLERLWISLWYDKFHLSRRISV